jgi:RecG-like helicase
MFVRLLTLQKQLGFENIAAATATFQEIKAFINQIPVLKLPSCMVVSNPKLKPKLSQIYCEKIQLLVTTPIVEVGVDLPAANSSSLRPLKGLVCQPSSIKGKSRPGRTSQLLSLIYTSAIRPAKERLELFCQEHNGLKLAELDLNRRGAGRLIWHQSIWL